MVKKIVFLFFCVPIIAAPLEDKGIRFSTQVSLKLMQERLEKNGIATKPLPNIANLEGEETIYANSIPTLYTIKDGTCIIKQSRIDSFATFRLHEQLTNDEATFYHSSVRKYRVPFVSGNGIKIKKDKHTQESVYVLNYRKKSPEYMHVSGDAQVYLQGNCPFTGPVEIWLTDNAILFADNLEDAPNITLHVRDSATIVIQKGTAKDMYISPQGENVRANFGGVATENVIVNTSNGPIGSVTVNPQIHYFRLGKRVIGNLESKSALQTPTELATKPYKAKRFFTKSLPKAVKKTVKGVAVAGGFAIITSAAVLSIMHGVFPAAAGLGIAAAAAVSSAATFTLGTRIRNLMRSGTKEIKRSI